MGGIQTGTYFSKIFIIKGRDGIGQETKCIYEFFWLFYLFFFFYKKSKYLGEYLQRIVSIDKMP